MRLDERATDHFTYLEVSCHGRQKIGCCEGLPDDESTQMALHATVRSAEAFRWFIALCFGREVIFKVNSGYRCKAWNKEVGGVADSQHIHGRALDITPIFADDGRRVPLDMFAGMAMAFGYRGVIPYPSFVHIDRRPLTPYYDTIVIPYPKPKEFTRHILIRE